MAIKTDTVLKTYFDAGDTNNFIVNGADYDTGLAQFTVTSTLGWNWHKIEYLLPRVI